MNRQLSTAKRILLLALCLLSFAVIRSNAQTITTIAGSASYGYSGDGSVAIAAKLYYPVGVAADGNGNLFIADQLNHRIRKVDTSGVITTIAGTGTIGYSGDGSAATAAQLYDPYSVALDGIGNIFIADMGNNRVRKVDTSGVITTIAGTGVSGYSGDGGPATAARLDGPTGVAVDGRGNVYISDYYNSRVRKVDTLGIVITIAGTGTAGYSGDGGAAATAEIFYPASLAVDASGNVYIADRGNHRIRKVNASGVITTIAGVGTAGYSGDGGAATVAELNNPYGVAFNSRDNILYVADCTNQRIRKIDTSGVITTIAGTGPAGYSGDGGVATAAKLNSPVCVAVDSNGNVFVADYYNHRIRKINHCITPSAGAISGSPTLCISATATLSASGSGGGTWASSNTAHATVNASGVVTGTGAGSVTITYSVTNSCGTDVATRTMTINALPDAGTIAGTDSVCPGNTVTLTETVTGGNWSSASGAIATVSAIGVVTGVAAGTTTIRYDVTTTGCTSTATFVFHVGCTTGIDEIAGNNAGKLTIYPNPNQGNFSLLLTAGGAPQATVIITNVTGQIIKQFTMATNKISAVDFAAPSGLYVVAVTIDGRKYVEKITVSN